MSGMTKENEQSKIGRPAALTDSSILFARELHHATVGYDRIVAELRERGLEASRYSVRRAIKWLAPYDFGPSDSG